jgi:hypothetical protein
MVSQHRFHIFQLFSKLYLVALLLLGMPLCVQAQEDPLIRDIIEQLGPELGEDFDLSELVENLSYYQRKPIDLNRTSMEQLKSLFFLSPLQISNLLNYRSTNSKFSNVLELQGVDGFDVLTLQRLLPFVRVGAAADIKRQTRKSSSGLDKRWKSKGALRIYLAANTLVPVKSCLESTNTDIGILLLQIWCLKRMQVNTCSVVQTEDVWILLLVTSPCQTLAGSRR